MALAKQTLILIFISTNIILASCKRSHSTPSPAPDTSPSKPKDEKGSDESEDEKDKDTPGSKGGKEANVAKAVAKKMKAIEKKINEFNASLKKRMDDPESESGSTHGAHECVSECEEVLGAAIDDINKTLVSLENENLVKANFDVSAVSTNVDTCNDCFDEMVGGDPKAKKLSDWVQKTAEDALEALQKATD